MAETIVYGDGIQGPQGAGSTTDNAIPRFDGTNGVSVQNSGATIDDSNNMTIPGDLTVQGTTTTLGNFLVEDSLITLNSGGTTGGGTLISSTRAVGIEFEEDSSITGYIRTGLGTDSIASDETEIKIKSTGGSILTIDMDADGEIEFSASKKLTVSENCVLDQDLQQSATVVFADLTVDNLNIELNTISSTAGDINIIPVSASNIQITTAGGGDALFTIGTGGILSINSTKLLFTESADTLSSDAAVVSFANVLGVGISTFVDNLHIFDSSSTTVTIGDAVGTTVDNLQGLQLGANTAGNCFFDVKTFTGGFLRFRIGEGTEIAATRTWIEVDPTNGFVGIGMEGPESTLHLGTPTAELEFSDATTGVGLTQGGNIDGYITIEIGGNVLYIPAYDAAPA